MIRNIRFVKLKSTGTTGKLRERYEKELPDIPLKDIRKVITRYFQFAWILAAFDNNVIFREDMGKTTTITKEDKKMLISTERASSMLSKVYGFREYESTKNQDKFIRDLEKLLNDGKIYEYRDNLRKSKQKG